MDPTTQFTTKSDPNVTSAWCEHADWFHVCQSWQMKMKNKLQFFFVNMSQYPIFLFCVQSSDSGTKNTQETLRSFYTIWEVNKEV
jgi:hypothetical protein